MDLQAFCRLGKRKNNKHLALISVHIKSLIRRLKRKYYKYKRIFTNSRHPENLKLQGVFKPTHRRSRSLINTIQPQRRTPFGVDLMIICTSFLGVMLFIVGWLTNICALNVGLRSFPVVLQSRNSPQIKYRHTPKTRGMDILVLKTSPDEIVGEDAALFQMQSQSAKTWGSFVVAVSSVLSTVYFAWIYPEGPQWGNHFKDTIESMAGGDSTLSIVYMLGIFAVCHSGLALLRPFFEPLVGARPWRYIFALVSLPLAFSCIVYFLNHRCDKSNSKSLIDLSP